MKKLLFIFSSSLILLTCKAQVIPTIGDVFNYDIGDEFHANYSIATPNAIRVVITGKYFSPLNDTVFYIRQNNNYTSTFAGGMPPAVTYYTTSFVDTVFYTGLTDPISSVIGYVINDSCDTYHDTVYVSTPCNAQVYENSSCVDCCFEGDQYRNVYGVGLGWMHYYHFNPGNNFTQQMDQFYYKKAVSGDSCGTPDRLWYAGLKQTEAGKKITFYPNPSAGKLKITNVTNEAGIRVYDMYGKLMLEDRVKTDASTDVSSLSNGIYLLIIHDGDNVCCEKLVVEKN
jgi:hypothetical protein